MMYNLSYSYSLHIELGLKWNYIFRAVVDDKYIEAVHVAFASETPACISMLTNKHGASNILSFLDKRYHQGLYSEYNKLRKLVSSQKEFELKLQHHARKILNQLKLFQKDALPLMLQADNQEMIKNTKKYLDEIETDIITKLKFINDASSLFDCY